MTKQLDPKPVRWRSGKQRTAILGLLTTFPDAYVFDPRPEYSQERADYVNYVHRTTLTEDRILGADHAEAS